MFISKGSTLKPFLLKTANRKFNSFNYVIWKHRAFQVLILTISILDSEEIRASQVEPVNRQSVQNQVTRLSLVAGSWLFHDDDDDDDDANLWQLVLFAKIARCVSRFITKVKGVYVMTTSPCSRRLRLSKFSGSIGAPGVMRAQFRLIIKYVAGLLWSNRARRIARIKYANIMRHIHVACSHVWHAPGYLNLSPLPVSPARFLQNQVCYEKAFDIVDREMVWKVMRHYGIHVPEKVIHVALTRCKYQRYPQRSVVRKLWG